MAATEMTIAALSVESAAPASSHIQQPTPSSFALSPAKFSRAIQALCTKYYQQKHYHYHRTHATQNSHHLLHTNLLAASAATKLARNLDFAHPATLRILEFACKVMAHRWGWVSVLEGHAPSLGLYRPVWGFGFGPFCYFAFWFWTTWHFWHLGMGGRLL